MVLECMERLADNRAHLIWVPAHKVMKENSARKEVSTKLVRLAVSPQTKKEKRRKEDMAYV